jgi:hypothetical protein
MAAWLQAATTRACPVRQSERSATAAEAAFCTVTGAAAQANPASPGAWYDRNGQENGDKCAWTFGAPLVMFRNGVQWKIQGEWSNAAYTAGTGYPSASGQRGCLSGL